MKRFLACLLGLALTLSARAEWATNFYGFAFEFTPSVTLSPGPNSDLPYPVPLVIVSYPLDDGTWRNIESTNGAVGIDFTGIASPHFFIAIAQTAWRAVEQGTNAMVFGHLHLAGTTFLLPTNNFSFAADEEVQSDGWPAWAMFEIFGTVIPPEEGGSPSNAAWTINPLYGSAFGEAASLVIQNWQPSAHSQDAGGFFSLGVPPNSAPPNTVRFYGFAPSHQHYSPKQKFWRWFAWPNGGPEGPDQFAQANQAPSETQINSEGWTDTDGLMVVDIPDTNYIHMLRVFLTLPLANGDPVGAVTNRHPNP